jgi:uncharacterized protein (TIGR03000 family)
MCVRSFLFAAAVMAAAPLGALAQSAPGPDRDYAWVSYAGLAPSYAALGFYPGYWGFRHAWDYYPYGRFDYGLNYYGTAPTTRSFSAYYPAEVWITASARADGAAYLAVHVPPGATLWVDGRRTAQTGAQRQFVSPPLESGRDYTYEIRARWTEDGRTVDQVHKVQVRANTKALVDMTRTAGPWADRPESIASGPGMVARLGR